jgi:hypothetical protein
MFILQDGLDFTERLSLFLVKSFDERRMVHPNIFTVVHLRVEGGF